MAAVKTKVWDFKTLSILIEKGLRTANRKLIEETAARNGILVIGDKNGKPISVSAKDLLEEKL